MSTAGPSPRVGPDLSPGRSHLASVAEPQIALCTLPERRGQHSFVSSAGHSSVCVTVWQGLSVLVT